MRNILVTGTSYGLGKTIRETLVARGDQVSSIQRTRLNQSCGHSYEFDLSRWQEVDDLVRIIALYDKAFDGIVFNAALADKSVNQWLLDEVYRHIVVNTFGVLALYESLRNFGLINQQHCNIVLISSFLQNGNVRQPAYAMSKAALYAWMTSFTMAQPRNDPVLMNMLWPGRVVTPANPLRELPPEDPNFFREPIDIMPAVLFLLDQPLTGMRGKILDMGR